MVSWCRTNWADCDFVNIQGDMRPAVNVKHPRTYLNLADLMESKVSLLQKMKLWTEDHDLPAGGPRANH